MKKECNVKGCSKLVVKGSEYCEYHTVEMDTLNGRTSSDQKYLVKMCSVEGCNKLVKTKGLCSTHYNSQLKKTGIVRIKECSTEGCTKIASSRGLCSACYSKLYRKAKRDGCTETIISKGSRVRLCSVEGCNNKHMGRGYCSSHYHKLISNANGARKPRSRSNKVRRYTSYMDCMVHGCDGRHEKRGLCAKHVYLMTNYGVHDIDKCNSIISKIPIGKVEVLKTPTKLQPIDTKIAIAYYGAVLEELHQYSHVIKIAREMFVNNNKMTVIKLDRYNEKNRLIIETTLYRLYFIHNMGMIPTYAK